MEKSASFKLVLLFHKLNEVKRYDSYSRYYYRRLVQQG